MAKKRSEYKPIEEMLKISELRNASKTLLANLRFASIDDPIKTIAVVSPNPNEGKTTVAVNLATAIASSGKTCLLVDCDMRKRRIYNIIDVKTKKGILSVLAGESRLADAITATKVKNLFFLDCEPNIPSPPDTLSTKRFTALVDSLHDAFDYVVFDTSPILTFVDAAIIANLVDATVLCVRQYKTKRNDVIDAKKQLTVAQAKIRGCVMTFAEEQESDYYYAYYDKSGKRVDRAHKNDFALADDDVSGMTFAELEQSDKLGDASVGQVSTPIPPSGQDTVTHIDPTYDKKKKRKLGKKKKS